MGFNMVFIIFCAFGTIFQLLPSSVAFLVSAREFVCIEQSHKLVTDAWSVKDQLVYLRLNHYVNTTKEVDTRLVVYDVLQDKFLSIFLPHDRHTLSQAEVSTKLSDVISVSLMNSIDASRSPSILYFDSRVALRANCAQSWLYDPPNSGFCRRHAVTSFLGRILGIVNQMSLNKPDTIDYDIYRTSLRLDDHFPAATVKQVRMDCLGGNP